AHAAMSETASTGSNLRSRWHSLGGRDPGRRLVVRLLPVAVLVSILAGLLRWEGERLDVYSSGIGIVLMVLFMIVLSLALLLLVAQQLRHSEQTRLRAEEALLDERFLLQTLVETSPDHIYFKDTQHRFIRINPSTATHLGLGDPDAAVGRTDADFFAEEHVQKAALDEQRLFREGVP